MRILVHLPELATREMIQFQMIVCVDQTGIQQAALQIDLRIAALWWIIQREDAVAIKAQRCWMSRATIGW